MTRDKEAPTTVPSLSVLLIQVTPDERVQIESLDRAISEKIMLGRLVTNWCAKCRRWRFQFVSNERLKSVLSNETFLCTKCGTPVPLLTDNAHTLAAS